MTLLRLLPGGADARLRRRQQLHDLLIVVAVAAAVALDPVAC